MRGAVRCCVWSVLLLLAGCDGEQSRPPDDPEILTRPSDLTAVVYRTARRSGATPVGPITQYELLVGAPESSAPDAGLVLGEATPVFRRDGDDLIPVTPGAIAAGQLIEVWHNGSVIYGATVAPPGAPAYYALQVAIREP